MLSHNVRSWVETATDGRVISVTALSGATSSVVHRVEVESNGACRSLVLRRFTNDDWVRAEPDVAVREGVSVQHAARAGLPAPELVATDKDGTYCGVPATLVTLLRGAVVLQPVNWNDWIQGLAHAAAQIHRVDAAGFRWKYRRYNDRDSIQVPRWSQQPDAWRKAIDVVQGAAPSYR